MPERLEQEGVSFDDEGRTRPQQPLSAHRERNVELNRRLIEAFNARDLDAMLALVDRTCEWHSAFAAVFGGVYRGREGVRRWHRDLEDAWGEEPFL